METYKHFTDTQIGFHYKNMLMNLPALMLILFRNRLYSQEISRQVLPQAFEKMKRIELCLLYFAILLMYTNYVSNICKYLYIQCNCCVCFDYYDAIVVILYMTSSTPERFRRFGLGL